MASVFDLQLTKYCFHCGMGKENKKYLKLIEKDSEESKAVRVCFGFECENGYLCTNCCGIVKNLCNKYVSIKNRCEIMIGSICHGTMSPSKIPLKVGKTTHSKTEHLSAKSPSPSKIPRLKRHYESPCVSITSSTTVTTKPVSKKIKRSLFASG